MSEASSAIAALCGQIDGSAEGPKVIVWAGMSKTDAVLAQIGANPGASINAILAGLREVGRDDISSNLIAAICLQLFRDGRASRKKAGGMWSYWLADDAPPQKSPAALLVHAGSREGRQVAGEEVTPDWLVIRLRDGAVVLVHKDTQAGFRLDPETVQAIRRLPA